MTFYIGIGFIVLAALCVPFWVAAFWIAAFGTFSDERAERRAFAQELVARHQTSPAAHLEARGTVRNAPTEAR